MAKEVGVLADRVAKEVRVINCPCSQRGRGHLMTVRVATERTEVGYTNTTTKHMQTNGHRQHPRQEGEFRRFTCHPKLFTGKNPATFKLST